MPPEFTEAMLERLPLVVGLHAVIFWTFGLYRGMWRFASLPDLQRIVLAVGLAGLAVPAVLVMLRLGDVVPRSVYLHRAVLLVLAMGGSRFAYRVWKEHRLAPLVAHPRRSRCWSSAPATPRALLKELERSRQWRVVGLLDDDPAKRGRQLRGVAVLGAVAELGALRSATASRKAIIAMPGDARRRRRAPSSARRPASRR